MSLGYLHNPSQSAFSLWYQGLDPDRNGFVWLQNRRLPEKKVSLWFQRLATFLGVVGMGWHGTCTYRGRACAARLLFARPSPASRLARLAWAFRGLQTSLTITCRIAVLRERSPIAWLDCNTLKTQRFGSVARFLRRRRETPQAKVISLRKS